jgi:hypothetical protein
MVYGTSGIKRNRRNNAEIQRIKDALVDLIAQEKPITCRQAYYGLVARQLIAKTKQEYQNVCRYLCNMRRQRVISYSDIADNTRWVRQIKRHSSLQSALQHTRQTYRRMLWADQSVYVEIWCESDSIASVLTPITYDFDVPLHAMRGFASETYLYSVADNLFNETRPIYIYYFGDYDPSGVYIDKHAEKKVREFAPHLNITLERVAVTAEQIEEYKLPGSPTKKTDSRAAKFDRSEAVEIETFTPTQLRKICEDSIVQHIDELTWARTKWVERAEKDSLARVISQLQIKLRLDDEETDDEETDDEETDDEETDDEETDDEETDDEETDDEETDDEETDDEETDDDSDDL